MAIRWFVLLLGVALFQGSLSFSPIPEMMTMEEDWTQFNERIGNPQFRLPTTTSPRHYEVLLTPYFDIVPSPGISPFSFQGQATIYTSPTVENVNEIVMHCNDLVINTLTVTYVTESNQNPVDITAPNQEFQCDPELQFLRIRTSTPLLLGQEYIIRTTFVGNLQTNMRGFYRSWYRDSTGVRWMGTTQFQPGYARQAFPCYDEPAFKATFDISISREQGFSVTLSNMPLRISDPVVNGRITDHFHTTPKQSTYLIAFIVSHYTVVANNNNNNRPFQIYARNNIGSDGEWSLDVGERLLARMEEYTSIPYYTMAPNMNMKQAAIPDFSAGAMENWGLLTYREALLLYNPAKSNHFYRQRIANIVCHEIAHMWFGNLVTCGWWENLWLNEGFARFYQYYLTDEVEPTLGFRTRFIVEQVHVAMFADSVDNAHPLTDPTVTDPTSVSNHLSTITYAKGAAVLRMTQHLLGDSTFVKGLRSYLNDRAYKTAEPDHLFDALDAAAIEDSALTAYSGITIKEYFKTWSEKAGHPLLTVSINQQTGRMTVVQSRWERDTGVSTYPSLWQIPITWTRQGDVDFDNLKPSRFLTAQVTTIERGTPGLEWVIFNKQESGFYRVNYDDTNWSLLTRALRDDTERLRIHEFNRAQIVDDLFAFARASVMPYQRAFNILSFLEKEDAYAPWIAAIAGYEWIIRRLAHNSSATEELNKIIIDNSVAVVTRLGFEETASDSYMTGLQRMYVNQFLCNVGHTQCITAAQQSFQAWRNTQANILPNLRPWVYCAGLRAGNAADFDYFWSQYLAEEHASEQLVMIQAAGCTLDSDSLNKFWDSITDSTTFPPIIRAQDISSAIASAINRNEENTMRSFNYIRNNLERTRVSIGLATPLNTIIGRLLNEEQITEVNTWLTENQALLGESVYNVGVNAIANARSNINWYNQRVSEFSAYFDTGYVPDDLTEPTTVPPTTIPPTTIVCLTSRSYVAVGTAMGTNMLLSSFLVILVGAASAVPFDDLRENFEFMDRSTNLVEPGYRLTDSVFPTTMKVDLDVYLQEANFTGIVEIGVDVREENLTTIVLHQNVVAITGVNLADANGDPVPLRFPNPFTTHSYYEILEINLAYPIPTGRYVITVSYLGKINENPIDRGFYRGYYYLGNELRLYATTQFQPFHARKAFPCFDEPQFKSVYTISITRDSSLSQSYSNMDIAQREVVGDRVRETFYPTPIISAYLVAFHVSDFVSTNLTSIDARPFQIISRQGVTDQHEYAADIGLRITTELDDKFGIQYHEMGQGVLMKNDHIALPDFPSGAMENWGMVNYREAYLLYDPQNTNIINKIFIATIMAHELAHKWFGNLVTCFWWSNLWLNESYASFYEYFGAHYADPSLELDDQFVVDYVHSALTWDAGAGATPMNWTAVETNPSISSHFSTTSYAKGASVLRMLQHFVGERNFRNALRYYLRDNAYEVGTPENMYDGFRQATSEDFTFARDYPNVEIGEVFDSWVQNPGSPVVNVDVNMETGVITLSQQRYQLTGTPNAALWHIPITWTHSGNLDFSSTKPAFVLANESTTIQNTPGHNFVILNIAQSGLYRVNYDDHNWEMIASYLRSNNRERIHKLNRAQIVNDVLFFIRGSNINVTRGFDVLSFLSQETDYYVWNGALTQLDWIHRRLEHIPNGHHEFTNYLLWLLDDVIRHLGYDERPNDSTSTILNRMQIMNLACNLGHEGCIADSLQKWEAYKANDSALVPVNLRRYVYCTGLRQGNSSDYDFLYSKYNSSENTADMVVILRALACTKDEDSLNHYLQQSMYNDKVRIHDKTNAFSFALQGNPENRPIVLNWLYQNFEEIRETYGGPARLTICINAVTPFLTNFTHIEDFQEWAYSNQVALGESFSAASSVVTGAMSNLDWGNDKATEIYNFLLTTSAASSIITPVILLFVAMLAHFIR